MCGKKCTWWCFERVDWNFNWGPRKDIRPCMSPLKIAGLKWSRKSHLLYIIQCTHRLTNILYNASFGIYQTVFFLHPATRCQKIYLYIFVCIFVYICVYSRCQPKEGRELPLTALYEPKSFWFSLHGWNIKQQWNWNCWEMNRRWRPFFKRSQTAMTLPNVVKPKNYPPPPNPTPTQHHPTWCCIFTMAKSDWRGPERITPNQKITPHYLPLHLLWQKLIQKSRGRVDWLFDLWMVWYKFWLICQCKPFKAGRMHWCKVGNASAKMPILN